MINETHTSAKIKSSEKRKEGTWGKKLHYEQHQEEIRKKQKPTKSNSQKQFPELRLPNNGEETELADRGKFSNQFSQLLNSQ